MSEQECFHNPGADAGGSGERSCTRRAFLYLTAGAAMDRQSSDCTSAPFVSTQPSRSLADSWTKANELMRQAESLLTPEESGPAIAGVLAAGALLTAADLSKLVEAFRYQEPGLSLDRAAFNVRPSAKDTPLVPYARALLAVAAVSSDRNIADAHELFRALQDPTMCHFGTAHLTALALHAGILSPDNIRNRYNQVRDELQGNARLGGLGAAAASYLLAGAALVTDSDVRDLVHSYEYVHCDRLLSIGAEQLVATAALSGRSISHLVDTHSKIAEVQGDNWSLDPWIRISAAVGGGATGASTDSINEVLRRKEFGPPEFSWQQGELGPQKVRVSYTPCYKLFAAALLACNPPKHALAIATLM